jgi:glycosyltransferase involved in cell wall biosynthesis
MPPATSISTVIYLHQYFRTPEEGGALRSWFVAEELARQGARVELITAHNSAQYAQRALSERLTVHYLPVAYDNRFGVVARGWAFMRFALGALRLAARLAVEASGPVKCFATSTPLTVGAVARMLRAWRGVPYVFEVRDLWPEAPIQLGYIRTAPMRWALRRLERWIYAGAQHIVALSPGMVAGVQASGTTTPVTLVPNMADTEAFQPFFAGTAAPDAPFIVFYAGALGRANRVGFLLDAAAATQRAGLPEVQFVIAGDGAEAADLRAEAARRHLANVQFVGTLDRDGVQRWRAQAAASITCFDTLPILDTNSPNKFFEGLAAGALSITTTRGWLRELVETHACGFGYDPRQPETFVAALRPYVADRERLRVDQTNARRLAEAEFSRSRLVATVATVVLAP